MKREKKVHIEEGKCSDTFDMLGYVQICSNSFGYVQIRSDMLRYIQICSDKFRYILKHCEMSETFKKNLFKNDPSKMISLNCEAWGREK